MAKYVPGLTRGNEVTIREILSHTSGYQDYAPEDYLMTIADGARDAAPDSRYLGHEAARL